MSTTEHRPGPQYKSSESSRRHLNVDTAAIHSRQLQQLLAMARGHGIRSAPSLPHSAEQVINELTEGVLKAFSVSPTKTMDRQSSNHVTRRHEKQAQQMQAFRSVFSDTESTLRSHRQPLADKMEEIGKEREELFQTCYETLHTSNAEVAHIQAAMKNMDEQYKKLNMTASGVGSLLSSLQDQKQTADETKEIMKTWQVLGNPNGQLFIQDELLNSLKDPLEQKKTALVMKRLLAFTDEMKDIELGPAQMELEQLKQRMESDLLEKYTLAQKDRDVVMMKSCAEAISDFSTRDKVVDRYIWNVLQNRLDKLREASQSGEVSLNPMQDLDSLLSKLTLVIRTEFTLIQSVFEPSWNALNVQERLLRRLYQDPAFGISSILDQILFLSDCVATSITLEQLDEQMQYVKLLCTAYQKVSAFTSTVTALMITKTDTLEAHNAIQRFANGQMHSLFGVHIDKFSRLAPTLLTSLLRQYLEQVSLPISSRVKGKNMMTKSTALPLQSIVKSVSWSSSSGSASRSSSSQKSKVSDRIQVPSSSSDLCASKGGKMSKEEASDWHYVALSTALGDKQVLDDCLRVLKDLVENCECLLKDEKLMLDLCTIFVGEVGDKYLKKSTELGNELLRGKLLTHDSVMHYLDILEVLLDRIDVFDATFIDIVDVSFDETGDAAQACYNVESACLETIQSFLSDGLKEVNVVIIKQLTEILSSSQEKTDFHVHNNSILSCTNACKAGSDYLKPIVKSVTKILVGANRDCFLSDLVMSFRVAYLSHLQKLKFDPDGACVLLQDVSTFAQVFRHTKVPAVEENFQLLREVASLFTLAPDNVAGYVKDSMLSGNLDMGSIKALIKRRADYKTHGDRIVLK